MLFNVRIVNLTSPASQLGGVFAENFLSPSSSTWSFRLQQ